MIINRVKTIIEKENLSVNAFSKLIDVSEARIRKAIKESSDISSSIISKIIQQFPNYSSRWVLTGEGNMLLTNNQNHLDATNGVLVPFYGSKASAGHGLDLTNDFIEEIIPIQFAKEGDMGIQVYGDSMLPSISNKDYIIVRDYDFASYQLFGQIHVFVTEDGVLCKVLKEIDDEGNVILESLNTSYKDIRLPSDKVYKVYLAVGKVSFDKFI
ncbi:S24 family peptidase [Flammeovirga sp. SJP92]|uniref:S24 family peptidase n=1 Tax=Flammeovirga sp. SJP92 TaxID=1775430 RepID=UPI001560B405|nr:S24 family peptidase [Flammeovirga sp. SJP92]